MIGWIDTIVQGILLGGLYALFAMGLSLIFGVMRLVNISHGDFIILAAYAALMVGAVLLGGAHFAGIGPFVALLIVAPMMFGLGYALQRGVLNRTLGGDILPPLLVTFGLSIIIQNVLLEIFSADTRSLKAGGLETASFRLAGQITVGWFPLLTLLAGLAVTLALTLLFGRTRLGRAFRATSDDPEAAQLMGINSAHIYALAMGIALGIVAIAGIFFAIRTTFTPTDGPDHLLYAFEAVIIGGLGSFWGTFAGGIILGVAQAIGFRLDPGWGVLAGHLVFLAALVFKPSGLFPRTRG
jgi:branched-chain amino acid transport system permease protein